MKRLIIALAILAIAGVTYFAMEYDRTITFKDLPPKAQALINTNFEGNSPIFITTDWDDYKVVLSGAQKLEFDRDGDWRDIECGIAGVPVSILPPPIAAHVAQTFPGAKISSISKNWQGYDVELNTGLEIEYDNNFQVTRIDD